ncbi:hypothetical protein B0H11DRAFT_2347345 [Mycena galericulata]|nr:hypothetical protein B0H11DRAFT_2347345 [Mycena galericulata]
MAVAILAGDSALNNDALWTWDERKKRGHDAIKGRRFCGSAADQIETDDLLQILVGTTDSGTLQLWSQCSLSVLLQTRSNPVNVGLLSNAKVRPTWPGMSFVSESNKLVPGRCSCFDDAEGVTPGQKFIELMLHMAQPFLGDRQKSGRTEIYSLPESSTMEDTLLPASYLENGKFKLRLWYARCRQVALGISPRKVKVRQRYLARVGDAYAGMAATLLENSYEDVFYKCKDEFEIKDDTEHPELYIVREPKFKTEKKMPTAYLRNPKFDLTGWFDKFESVLEFDSDSELDIGDGEVDYGIFEDLSDHDIGAECDSDSVLELQGVRDSSEEGGDEDSEVAPPVIVPDHEDSRAVALDVPPDLSTEVCAPWWDCTIWIRSSTGRLCVDLIAPPYSGGLSLYSTILDSSPTPFRSVFEPHEDSKTIDSVSLEHYHDICSYHFAQYRELCISTNASVISLTQTRRTRTAASEPTPPAPANPLGT